VSLAGVALREVGLREVGLREVILGEVSLIPSSWYLFLTPIFLVLQQSSPVLVLENITARIWLSAALYFKREKVDKQGCFHHGKSLQAAISSPSSLVFLLSFMSVFFEADERFGVCPSRRHRPSR